MVSLNVFSLFILAWVLPATDFGQFVFLWAIAIALGVLAAAGGPAYLLRELSARRQKADRGILPLELFTIAIVAPAIIIASVYVLYATLPLNVFGLGSDKIETDHIPMVCAASYTFVLLNYFSVYLRIANLPNFAMFAGEGGQHLVLMCSSIITLAIAEASVLNILQMYLAVFLLSLALLVLAAIFGHLPRISIWRNPAVRRRRGLRDFWGTGVVTAVSSQIDILLGGLFLNFSSLGYYQILRKFANLANLPKLIATWTAMIPIGAAHASDDLSRVRKECRKAARNVYLPSIAIFPTIIASAIIAFHLLSYEWNLDAVLAFAALLSSAAVNLYFCTNFAVAAQCGLEKYVLVSRICGLIVAVTIILAVGENASSFSLALSVLAALTVANLLVWASVYHRLKIDTSMASSFMVRRALKR